MIHLSSEYLDGKAAATGQQSTGETFISVGFRAVQSRTISLNNYSICGAEHENNFWVVLWDFCSWSAPIVYVCKTMNDAIRSPQSIWQANRLTVYRFAIWKGNVILLAQQQSCVYVFPITILKHDVVEVWPVSYSTDVYFTNEWIEFERRYISFVYSSTGCKQQKVYGKDCTAYLVFIHHINIFICLQ